MEKKGIEINPEEIEFRYDFQVYGFNKMYIDPEKALRRSQDFIYHYEFIALLGEAIEKAREEKHTLVNQSYETIRDRALEIIDEELNLEYATPRYNLDGINEIRNQIENDMIQVLDDRIQEMIKNILLKMLPGIDNMKLRIIQNQLVNNHQIIKSLDHHEITPAKKL